jgi:hypothetical protein
MENGMRNLTIKMWILFSLSLAAFNSEAQEVYGGFTFSKGMAPEQVNLVMDDIKLLYMLPVMKDSNNFQKLADLKALSGPGYHNWILNRIHYFVSWEENLDSLYYLGRQPYLYPNADLLPNLRGKSLSKYGDYDDDSSGDEGPLAANLGGSLYIRGKAAKTLGTATINGKTMPVLSPRIGIMAIEENYFNRDFLPDPNPFAKISRLYRLSTLFHEARHSDGHGVETGFLHVVCPKGHAFEGKLACDRVENGSYGLEARFDKVLSANCTDCTPAEKEALRLMSLENFSRLLVSPLAASRVVKLQQLLATYKYILKTCEPAAGESRSVCDQQTITTTTQQYNSVRNQIDATFRLAREKNLRPMVDATPEGFFQELDLEQSQALMPMKVAPPAPVETYID